MGVLTQLTALLLYCVAGTLEFIRENLINTSFARRVTWISHP